jgi:hypothetical protein
MILAIIANYYLIFAILFMQLRGNVAMAITRVYQKLGCTTLRFNFRGVGNSQGSYGDGIGEKEDVKAAIAYLAVLPGLIWPGILLGPGSMVT